VTEYINLATLLFLGLLGLTLMIGAICHLINLEWKQHDDNEWPEFRTADAGLLRADARAALRKANDMRGTS
jgi:hypothetical protein